MALSKKSAQPTTDSSPPIHRWDQRDQERQSVKRTAESGRACQSRIYQSSVSRTGPPGTAYPALKCWAIFTSPLRGLSKTALFGQSESVPANLLRYGCAAHRRGPASLSFRLKLRISLVLETYCPKDRHEFITALRGF